MACFVVPALPNGLVQLSFLGIFKPSRWLKLKLGRLIDRFRDSFYEGPDPPARLAERVRLFRLYYPKATAEQWASFALQFGSNCYREGFTRGFEWCERGWEGPAIPPEQAAEMLAQDWSLADSNPDWNRMLTMGYDPHDPLAGISPEQRRAVVETLQGTGDYPVEINLSAYENDGNPGFHEEHDEEADD